MNLHFDSFHEGVWSNTKKVFVMLSIDLPWAIFLHRTQQPTKQPFQLTELRLNFGCTKRFIVLESMQMIVVLVIHIRRSLSCEENTNSGLGSRAILSNKIRIKLSCLNVDYFLFSAFFFSVLFVLPLHSHLEYNLWFITMESPTQWNHLLGGDNASTVAFEVLVLSFKEYFKRILYTHLNDDNGHRSLFTWPIGALGFPIESNPLCTNLFRKWFWDAIQILSIL